ncbi:MAG: DUF3343 domain-containing protein [Monoglobales bacterium]
MIKINGLLITFSSATTATRIKNELIKNKYPAKVVQTPKSLTKNGCSYSVRTTAQAVPAAERAAENLGVRIKNIFIHDGKDYVSYIRGSK